MRKDIAGIAALKQRNLLSVFVTADATVLLTVLRVAWVSESHPNVSKIQ